MSTTRFFSGARPPGGSFSKEDRQFFFQTKGKLSSAERWKRIRDRKFAENKKKTMGGIKTFAIPGTVGQAFKMSKRAELTLQEMAKKKAAKEMKEIKQRVRVKPRTFANGGIVKSGRIYDAAGNTIGKVNLKNGRIVLSSGATIGRYNPKSVLTNMLIQDAINKYSPYFINLRKMQAMQQGEAMMGASEVLNIYGRAPVSHHYNEYSDHSHISHGDPGVYGGFTSDQAGPRQNVGATAWGAMSDNVWGTYTDNVWGTSTDTVWGTNTSDVWGGIGGNPWGSAKAMRIWGSGSGHNYLAAAANKVALFFGLHLQSLLGRVFHEAAGNFSLSRFAAHDAHEHMQTTRAAVHDAHEHAITTRAPINPLPRK